ncbi:RluA family pseudouridine synthase [Candidatus Nomurabacteria bacterium]|nr:RluA family pseudouridine synthase [Candidatus Nomurabacteria bacterium]
MNPQILYEDKDVLVLNKPAGLIVHSDGRTKEKTLSDWILEKYPNIKEVGEPLTLSNGVKIYRPGIVHRLDRETSGALVVAKNQDTFNFLKKQFQGREIRKIYNAFVYGEMKDDEGVIDRPIGKSRKDFRMWSAQRGARGEMREAVTEYKVLKRGGGFSFIEVSPKTGRTHQIRVHMKAINHPVVCDKLYAPKQPKSLGFDRLALHSRNISFTMPNGQNKTVEAPLSQDFQEGLVNMDKLLQE